MSLMFLSNDVAQRMLQQRTFRTAAKPSEKCPTCLTNGHWFEFNIAGGVAK
jgi:hypothetical protein